MCWYHFWQDETAGPCDNGSFYGGHARRPPPRAPTPPPARAQSSAPASQESHPRRHHRRRHSYSSSRRPPIPWCAQVGVCPECRVTNNNHNNTPRPEQQQDAAHIDISPALQSRLALLEMQVKRLNERLNSIAGWGAALKACLDAHRGGLACAEERTRALERKHEAVLPLFEHFVEMQLGFRFDGAGQRWLRLDEKTRLWVPTERPSGPFERRTGT